MRVAMGLALAEKKEERTKWAKEFYWVLSNRKFLNSTPTLFNAGTLRPQLSVASSSLWTTILLYLQTLREAAMYSKHSGGIGTDYSTVRAKDPLYPYPGPCRWSYPYLRLLDVTMSGFDQGGRRPGSAAPYLADWHGILKTT